MHKLSAASFGFWLGVEGSSEKLLQLAATMYVCMCVCTAVTVRRQYVFSSLCSRLVPLLLRVLLFFLLGLRASVEPPQHLPPTAGLHSIHVAPGHGQLGPAGELCRRCHHACAHRDRGEVHGPAGLVPERHQGERMIMTEMRKGCTNTSFVVCMRLDYFFFYEPAICRTTNEI